MEITVRAKVFSTESARVYRFLVEGDQVRVWVRQINHPDWDDYKFPMEQLKFSGIQSQNAS